VKRGYWLLGVFVIGCHSGPQIRASGEVIKTNIERARRNNAMRCAPVELAKAEANLDFALGELDGDVVEGLGGAGAFGDVCGGEEGHGGRRREVYGRN